MLEMYVNVTSMFPNIRKYMETIQYNESYVWKYCQDLTFIILNCMHMFAYILKHTSTVHMTLRYIGFAYEVLFLPVHYIVEP